MSPRPRKATDDEVFAAAARLMARVGPTQLTLVDIAAEVELTAGALVQRFGSKRGLLLAFSARTAASTGQFFASLRAEHPSPLAALRGYADCFARMAESPAAVARNLSYLQLDLTDAGFRKHVMVQARATRVGLRSLITAAVAAGELLPAAKPDRLARTVEALLSGSLMAWAFYRKGSAARWVRDDLEAILQPYVPPARQRRPTRRFNG